VFHSYFCDLRASTDSKGMILRTYTSWHCGILPLRVLDESIQQVYLLLRIILNYICICAFMPFTSDHGVVAAVGK
jgi:hypothetical protein